MSIEVEEKFPVADLAQIEAKLAQMGVVAGESRIEIDLYLRSPARDFSATDEALRIRRIGSTGCLTYKGPKINTTTKTRREIELPLGEEPLRTATWQELLEALGFRPVAEVHKRRRKAMVPWQGRQIEVSLDNVDEVGTFVELELVTEPADVDAAKRCTALLAKRLDLFHGERRSYLELLLKRRST